MRTLIGDGKDVLFWLDRWVDERPVRAYLLHELNFADLHKFVADYWTNGVGWNWLAFQTFLPSHIIERIRAVMVHDESDLKDSWFWSHTTDGEFSVHTAYNYLVSDFLLTGQCELRQIWSLNVPSRVRSTLWLIKHQNLMCNAKRKRRGFTSIDLCIICSGGTEDVDHVFRSCSAASLLWASSLSPQAA